MRFLVAIGIRRATLGTGALEKGEHERICRVGSRLTGMKAPISLFVVLLGFSIGAQTNVIELNNRVVEFHDLKGKEYKVELVRATLDGVIYSVPGGGGMIRYSDLSPENLIEWGIPTNRIDIAAQRAAAKKQAREAFNAQGEAGAFQRSINVAVGQATSTYRQRLQAAENKLKPVENNVKLIGGQLSAVKAQRELALNRPTYADYYGSASVSRVYVQTEADRLAEIRTLDARASDLEGQLAIAEKELEVAKENYKKEVQQIEQDYNSQLQALKNAGSRNAPANPDNPEQSPSN